MGQKYQFQDVSISVRTVGIVYYGLLLYHFFFTDNPSDRTKALGSTQPLKEMRTRDIPWKVKVADAYD
jgi:hypothetical protein